MGVGDLARLVIIVVVATITVTMGALVLSNMSYTSGITSAANATIAQGQSALSTIGSFLPIVALVVVAAIIIGVVSSSFGGSAL